MVAGSRSYHYPFMSESYIQNLFADRIGGRQYGKSTAIYKFEKIKRAKRAAWPPILARKLSTWALANRTKWPFRKLSTRFAPRRGSQRIADTPITAMTVLKQAAARYLERVCGVSGINPDTEVIHSIGSKAALSILPAALINPGDYVFMTTPGYPVFGTHAKYYGGLVHNLPLTEANHFLPDLDSIPDGVLRKAKVLVMNYPNNPTGASATPEFFAKSSHSPGGTTSSLSMTRLMPRWCSKAIL